MCGLVGLINLDGQPVDQKILGRMTEALSHRGPDGEGYYLNGPVGLGHRRLAIIDPAGGRQPMSSPEGQCWLSYNGEVYNYLELREELRRLGHRFNTDSDSEVVLRSYMQWGRQSLHRLRGMFALAVLDRPANRLFLARDRLGIKPLIYGRVGQRLAFASELQALKIAFDGQLSLDHEALDNYLQWQYIPAPLTIYGQARKLPPAHFLEIDLSSGSMRLERYWRLDFEEDKSLAFEEWADLLDQELRQAVNLRLRSDVAFGAFLSGGVDSSLVVHYMAELMDKPVKAFSIGFDIGDWSELDYARAATQLSGAEHRVEKVRPDAVALLPLLARHYGEPYADSSAIPTYYVSQMARREVKMVLSGDGGDEVFAGYNPYEAVQARLLTEEGVPLAKDAALFWLARWLKKGVVRYERWRTAAQTPHALYLHARWLSHFSYAQRKSLYRTSLRTCLADRVAERKALFAQTEAPLVSRLQLIDLNTYLPHDILTKVDVASMANSLEVRVPLLDHKVVELAAKMPSEFKFRARSSAQGTTFEKKIILRHLAKRYFPAAHIDRSKMGFGIPLGPWFKKELRPWVEKRVCGSDRLAAFFKPRRVRRIVDRHFNGRDRAPLIWSLIFLDEWLSQNEDIQLDL